MESEESRQKVLDWALAITQDTPIAPSALELRLLGKFVKGVLTIEEVIELLAEQEGTKPDKVT